MIAFKNNYPQLNEIAKIKVKEKEELVKKTRQLEAKLMKSKHSLD